MFDDIIAAESASQEVPEIFIRSTIQVESSGKPNAYRAEPRINDASYGLMQLLLTTARHLGYDGDPDGLYDPATNIHFGTMLLAQLGQRYGWDNPERIYSAYNSGRPDLYKTSTQVATDTAHFMKYFNSFLSAVEDTATEAINSVEDTAGAAVGAVQNKPILSGGLIIIALVAIGFIYFN